jgi:serine/threonine protein kinase
VGPRAGVASARNTGAEPSVSADNYSRAKAIFQEALGLEGTARAAFVDRACGGDSALRGEVESLLEVYEEAGDFLAAPAIVEAVSSAYPGPVRETDRESRVRMTMCAVCHRSFDSSTQICPDDQSPLVAIEDRFIGTTLDGIYRIEGFLGQGGMGAVYLARHELTERPAAIKVLSDAAGADPERVKRFIIEGKAACRFQHPNAIVVYDLRMSGEGILYMALEYVDGESLGRVLEAGGHMTPGEALDVLEPVASVLDAAHASGVIHRDIKPDNVMIGRERTQPPVVKVLDLGVAKLKEADTDLTRGAAIGTPAYMSPEQWGVPGFVAREGVDGRADVYSLGVMAYEMVVGVRPFTGPGRKDFRHQHLTLEPLAAHAANPAIPIGFSRAIDRALSKNPIGRHATAGELVAELRAALDPRGDLAADPLSTTAEARASPAPGNKREWIIGSGPQCTIVVANRTVSRRHCRLVESEGGYLLEDLGSTNGTFVNGIRIALPVRVTPSDLITLGLRERMPWPF